MASVIGIRKQLSPATEKMDLFYGICIVLDIIGIVVVFLLYYKIPVNRVEKREIELTEFDNELEKEDLINIAEADANNNSDLVEVDLN